jgi:hypothetical protein
LDEFKFMKLKSKLFAGAVAFTMVLSVAPFVASAQTTAELTAQINSLLAMIAQLQAQIAGGAAAGGSATTFTTDLTVGSKGADVTALQTWLVGKGFLTMPAGVAMGYFGSVTKAALAKYQVSAGITPAAGYFGPITRAKVNALAVVPGTPGSTVVPGSITTPGAEGTITVTSSNGSVVSTAYAGDSKDKILGIKVQAAGSDVAVQRIKVDLGANTTQYNRIWNTLYVVDDSGNVLSSLPLNSSSVVKDSGEYYATLTGMNFIVPKGQYKQLYIAADLYSTIDSTNWTATAGTYTVQLANLGVRAVDGAGIDQYGPTTGSTISSAVTVSGNLTDLATLTVSSNASTPTASVVVANQGSANNQYDQLPILTFDVQSKKDSVQITDLIVRVAKSGTGAAVASSTVYLFDGSTSLGTASLGTAVATGNYATFSNINYTIPKDTTKTLTLKVDVRSADSAVSTFIGYASSTGMTAQSSSGTTLTSTYKSGSVTGNSISSIKAGPVFTLTSRSISASAPQVGGTTAPSTSTLTAIFNLHVQAVGGAVTFGTVASGTPAFASSTSGFVVYVNGAANTSFNGYATSTSWSFPTICSTAGLTGATGSTCTLSENSSMDVPVTFMTQGRSTNSVAVASGLYSVQLAGINYQLTTGTYSSTFMNGLTDWRTSDVSFP